MNLFGLVSFVLIFGCLLSQGTAADASRNVATRRPPPAPKSLQRVGMTQSDVTYKPPEASRASASNAPRRTSVRQSELINRQSPASRPQHRRVQSLSQIERPISAEQSRQSGGLATHQRSGSSVQPNTAPQRATSGQLSQSRRLDRSASGSVRSVSDLRTPVVGQKVSGRRPPPAIRVTSDSQRSQAPPSVSQARPSGQHSRTQSQTQLGRSTSMPHTASQVGHGGSHQRSISGVQSSMAASRGTTSSGVLQQSRRLSREISRPAWRP
ncbi:uncharacterized protein FA14DRAFT_80751 [Meira miltonrushii]|uniref:Uncharacterized protein n=1 Tax=Meira miltonrushii TaxID=1280837 RepID=A0A316V623_9BASI|nr:uncharacterized protein FA14DRAFT_80751 [Meira miltonrushii]PWN33039.1 hypothetical protein FA14DRAFT_80751 [Meira miltonrushii]